MKTVFLLLTRSNTMLSRAIHALHGDAFTHVSISVDLQLRNFYSFARLYPEFPLPAGFVRETLDSGYFGTHRAMPSALYCLDVQDDVYAFIAARIEEMCERAADYRYSVMGLLLCQMDLAFERGRHFFCSQFVADLLEQSGALRLPKPPSLMRPMDFVGLPGLRLLYSGELEGAECAAYGYRLEGGFA